MANLPTRLAVMLLGALYGAQGLGKFLRGCCPSDAATRLAGSMAVVLAALYTLLNGGAHLAGLAVPNCTCFGTYFPQALGLSVLGQDLVVLVGSLFVFRVTRVGLCEGTPGAGDGATTA